MTLKKRNSITINAHTFGSFRVRDFEICERTSISQMEIIDIFIRSNYFLWQDKRFDNILYYDGVKKTHLTINWNFHGVYDVTKIVPADFMAVTYDSFKSNLEEFYFKMIGDDEDYVVDEMKKVLNEVVKVLDKYKSLDNTFYILTTSDINKRHRYTVFSNFFSSVIININTNTFLTLDFGDD